MSENVKALYLDLLQKSLCYEIYPEPPVPLGLAWCRRGWVKRCAARVLPALLERVGAQLCLTPRYTTKEIEEGRIWPSQAYTMIGSKRMGNLCGCVQTVLRENVPGDLIETGVWRGGACILMRGVLAANGITDRKVYVADSFCGLPKPNASVYPADEGDRHHRWSFLAVSRQQVEENFRRYGLLDSQVVFLEGWFKETLPHLPTRLLAVIRLDGDMYESTMDALRNLYPRLAPGGFCIVDDYGLSGCRAAVEDYRKEQGILEPLQDIDGMGTYWRRNLGR